MKKINLIVFMTVLFLNFVIQPISANTNHLLVLNTKKNTMGYYTNYKLVKNFKIASGKSTSPTPTGKTKIVNKIINRPYYKGGIPGGSPKNPLGDRWLGLPLAGTKGDTYAIHGNNNPSSIGKNISAGCVRMYNDDIRWLYNQVPIGTDVIIKYTEETDAEIAKGYGINLNIKNPGWYKENDKWYYVIENNEFYKNGWKKISDKWYYFEADGSMRTGWKKISDNWYYFETDGSMRTGWKKVSNEWYYFKQNGSMATNTTIDGWIVNSSGVATQQ